MQKVFCVGMWRCATKSISKALGILGYRTHGTFLDMFDGRMHTISIRQLHDLRIWKSKLHRIRDMSTRYDAFADSPWHFVYEYLYELYPNAIYILTIRKDNHTLAESEIKHNIMHGKKLEDLNRQFFINRYKYHNKKIRSFFNNKNANYHELIVENLNWNNLCKIVNCDIPKEIEFPHINKGLSYK